MMRRGILTVFLLLYVGVGYYSAISGTWSSVGIALLCVALSYIPSIVHAHWNIRTPNTRLLWYLVLITSSLVMGGIFNLYEQLWWWDLLVHTYAGVGIATIGRTELINHMDLHTQHAQLLVYSMALLLTLGLSAAWELYEFTVDPFTARTMQPHNTDTMHDLAGAVVGALFILVLHAHHKRKKTVDHEKDTT